MPECPSSDDLRSYGLDQARQKGVPEDMYDRQIRQESNWEHCRADGSLKVSSGNAVGVAQIIQRWHPNVDVTDPWASLRYSTDLMASHHQRYGSWRKALAAYNWGGGNVGGYTENGRVHPAWDGTREWRCPHEAVVAQCRTGQMHHYLDIALGPGWPEPGGVVVDGGTTGVTFEDYRDPEPAGRFPSMPKGVILHGSRSGAAGNPKAKEYAGTARYEQTNSAGLGWHATIGENVVAVHLTPQEWGWHALQASKVYLGVELAQATVDEPITDAQVNAFCAWFKKHVQPVWPSIPLHFPSHAEADREFNVNQGKSDAFPLGDPRMDDLRARVMKGLTVQPQPEPGQPDYAEPGQVGSGILEMMAEDGTKPAMPSTFLPLGASPAIAEQCWGMNGVQYLFHIPTGRRWRYVPAA